MGKLCDETFVFVWERDLYWSLRGHCVGHLGCRLTLHLDRSEERKRHVTIRKPASSLSAGTLLCANDIVLVVGLIHFSFLFLSQHNSNVQKVLPKECPPLRISALSAVPDKF